MLYNKIKKTKKILVKKNSLLCSSLDKKHKRYTLVDSRIWKKIKRVGKKLKKINSILSLLPSLKLKNKPRLSYWDDNIKYLLESRFVLWRKREKIMVELKKTNKALFSVLSEYMLKQNVSLMTNNIKKKEIKRHKASLLKKKKTKEPEEKKSKKNSQRNNKAFIKREYYVEWLAFWCKKLKVIANYFKYINFRKEEKNIKYSLLFKGVLRVYYYAKIKKFIFFNLKTLAYIVIYFRGVHSKVHVYNDSIFNDSYSKYILCQNISNNKKFNLEKLKKNLLHNYIDLKSYFLNYYKLMYLLFFWFLYFFDAHLLYLNYVIFSLWSRFLFLICSSNLDYKYLKMLHKYSSLYKELRRLETKSIDTHIYDSTMYYTYNRSRLDHNLLAYLFGDHIYNINKVSFNKTFSILNKNISTSGYIHSYFDIYKYRVVYLSSRYVNVEKNYIYSVNKKGLQLV